MLRFSLSKYIPEYGRKRPKHVEDLLYDRKMMYIIAVQMFEYTVKTILLQGTGKIIKIACKPIICWDWALVL
jgi:hypothetical protein